jgi:type VI protein secretion system component Hcp
MANATIVMKLQGPGGPIEGECTVDGYEGFIVLESWNWTLTTKDDKLVPSGISFNKVSDRATVAMLELLQTCKEAPSAVILVEEDSVDSDFEVKLTLSQVRILSFSLNGQVDEKSGSMEESWTVRRTSCASTTGAMPAGQRSVRDHVRSPRRSQVARADEARRDREPGPGS